MKKKESIRDDSEEEKGEHVYSFISFNLKNASFPLFFLFPFLFII